MLHEITHLAIARTQKGEPASWIYLKIRFTGKQRKLLSLVYGANMDENKETIELNNEEETTEETLEKAEEVTTEETSEEKSEAEAESSEESENDSDKQSESEKESSEESEDKTADKPAEEKETEETKAEEKKTKEPREKKAKKEKTDKKSLVERFGKRNLCIAGVAAAVIVLAVLIIVFAKGGSKKKADPEDTTYYTFSDVQKDVAYLANDQEQQDKLNRLIDPMKKSNPIDLNYVDQIAKIIGVDKSEYKSLVKGYSKDDKIPQSVFDEFYDTIIASGKVEGITTTDVFLHSMSGTENGITMLSDGYNYYDADNIKIDSDSRDKIYSFYEKNGTIFRTAGLSDAEHTVTNVLLTGFDKDAGTASFLLNNEIVTMACPESNNIKELVVNITFTNDGIKSIAPSGEEINGRITAVNEANLKIHDVGFYYYDDGFKVYDNSGDEPKEVYSSQFLVGYKNLKIYVEKRRVKAVVITDSELDSEEIRVLINDTNYNGYQLKDVTFSCSSDYTITFSDGKSEQKDSDSKVMFTPASFGMHESVTLSCNDPNGRFTIDSIERNGINPTYRGTFEVVMMGDFLYVVNKLPIEEYLYAVVSSELPDSYDDETFKAFAIVARGYACKMMESNQFSSYGADIDDSNSNLLYNYYPENERSMMIVNETYGMVPAYEDSIIMPYHFLTSCGITCTNTDVYNEDAQPYYGSNYETVEKQNTLLSSECSFKYFIDNGNDYDILEVDEPYYRWSIHYTDKEMTEAVNSVIDDRIKNTVDTVLVMEKPAEDDKSDDKKDDKSDDKKDDKSDKTDDKTDKTDDKTDNKDDKNTDDKTDSKTDDGTDAGTDAANSKDDDKKKYTDILENNSFVPAEEGVKLGDIQDVAVVSRSDAGVVKELLIIGSQNTIWVKGQTNVRYILNPANQTITKNDGSEAKGYSLMPSPFYYVEKVDDGYVVKGGGFGNGVGLSLSGAEILSEKGYNYEEIIEHYYNNVKLRNMFGLYDKDADQNPDEQDGEESTEATTEK